MYLMFDTETSGLAKNFKASVTDIDNWPRIVQLAYLLYDEDEKLLYGYNDLVKPEGFIIPEEATKIHGISQEKAEKEGLELKTVLKKFIATARYAELMIAHNIDFDMKVILCEVVRVFGEDKCNEVSAEIFAKERIACTMHKGVSVCQIKNSWGGFKWPKVAELYEKLFNKPFEGAHNAACDVQATAESYFEMKHKRLL
jgi:DNA polymerase III epsilon subunit-like protein